MENNMGKYYNNCPDLAEFSGFLNRVQTHDFGKGKGVQTFLHINVDVSQSYEGKRSNKGKRIELVLELGKTKHGDHEAMALIDNLIRDSKVGPDGRIEGGQRIYGKGPGFQISFWPWEGKDGMVAQFKSRAAPWAKLSFEPFRRGEEVSVAEEVATKIADTSF